MKKQRQGEADNPGPWNEESDSDGDVIPALIEEEDSDAENDMQTKEVALDTARAGTPATKGKDKPEEKQDATNKENSDVEQKQTGGETCTKGSCRRGLAAGVVRVGT